MTTRSEELQTIAKVRIFLIDLTDRRETPKVPMIIREEARRLLKHYPLLSAMITKEKTL